MVIIYHMKTNKILSILLFSFVILLGCKDDDSQDTTPPGSLSIENIVPTNGGGIISYSLPNDSDILFVRAEYTNSIGVMCIVFQVHIITLLKLMV